MLDSPNELRERICCICLTIFETLETIMQFAFLFLQKRLREKNHTKEKKMYFAQFHFFFD